jgi:hypothetical protein
MALDPHYITDGPLEEAFLDKDSGLPLSGGTITFYRDVSRSTKKTVYQLTGAPPNYSYVALDNPLTLNSIGVVQNNGGDNVVIYYYPYLDDGITPDLYYVVVRDLNGVDQFTREAWPNGVVSSQVDGESSAPVQNQISNPQFTKILINDVPGLTPSTTTYTVSSATNQVFAFAPDWNFIISGTGTVTVSRIAVAGSSQVPTSPPYVIQVAVSAGITFCYLSQRFNTNSGLWSSTITDSLFLSTALLARNELGADTSIQMYYHASSGTATLVPIFDEAIPTGISYTLYTGSSGVAIPVSDNSDSGESGYIDIYISFASNSTTRISSVQVVPSFNPAAAPVFQYDETSANRDQALLGSYYIPRNAISPIPSLLTAWDFALNPAQFGESKTITAGTPGYVWDQTICNSVTGNIAVTRNSITNAMKFTPVSANDSFYMIQYLTGAEAKEMLFTRLSSNISAYLGASVGTVTMKAYLFVGTAASVVPILPSSLGTLSTVGDFTLTGSGWSAIPRSGLDVARAQITADNPTVDNDIQFTGWEIIDSAQFNDTDKFAMVVTFAWTTAPVINVGSISLTKGDLPTRPAPKSKSDVLSECQYYYEKSYNQGIDAGTASILGVLLRQQGANPTSDGTHTDIATRSFGWTYVVPKRTAPTIVLYSPVTGASAKVSYTYSFNGVIETGIGYPYDQGLQTGTNPNIIGWVQTSNGMFGVYYFSNSQILIETVAGVQNGTDETYITFHYTADCRLGIIA